MEITFYLVELLRLHDCVIVPDLGGFVTNYRPAEMDLANNRFNPPVKEIIFTGKLSKNDGLLVNYISETEGVGYMEARLIISEFVDEVWSRLDNGETIAFPNIGTLQYDRNEKLIFEPEVHENFLLDAYGLEGFQFPQLEQERIHSSKRVFVDKEAIRPVFNSRKVKTLAIGLPILLALMYFPVTKYTWKNSSNGAVQTSSATSLPLDGTLVYSLLFKIDSAVIQKSPVIPSDTVSVKQSLVNEPQAEDLKIQTNSRFRVIGGCFKMRGNADKFLGKLQSGGFMPELKVLPNGTFLVIVQSYTDKNEATTALKSLRQSDPKTGYWISAN